jgi:hypothetical protein
MFMPNQFACQLKFAPSRFDQRRRSTPELSRGSQKAFEPTGEKHDENHAIGQSARMLCRAAVKVEIFPCEALVNNYGRLWNDRTCSSRFRHHHIARRDIAYMYRSSHLNGY